MINNEILIQLMAFWIRIRFFIPRGYKDCRDCSKGCSSYSGDGWNEPRISEWDCSLQENELFPLTQAYEVAKGEIDWNYATICPYYQPWTEAELKAMSEWEY